MESLSRRSSQQHQDTTPAAQDTVSSTDPSLQESSVLVSRPEPDEQTPPRIPPDNDLKKCWICFSDESEGGPETSAWRSPCPCALVAHEACLLDWIADLESPTTRKRTLGPPVIACPQCKSTIQLSRHAFVQVVRALERVAAKAVVPAAMTVAFSAMLHACAVHGLYTLTSIFDPADSRRILQPLINDLWSTARPADQLRSLVQHWRLRVGLPLIPPLLILSRTTLADSLLPILPVIFFATQGDTSNSLDLISWPPSASMTFAVLPYIRSAYNAYYQRVWAEREKKWLKAIQPRSNSTDDADQEVQLNQDQDDENQFEIQIDGNIWEVWAGAGQGEEGLVFEARVDEVLHHHDDHHAHPFDAPPLPDDAPEAQNPVPPPPLPQQQQQQNGDERLLSLAKAMAQTVMGALIFPTIASLSGTALTYILPLSWTAMPQKSSLFGMRTVRPTGLLQHKWARSLVGGCLFVVVKDAVMLYVRYKMAQQYQRRHVLDYDRKVKP
jgi:hypothetical protein